MSSSLPLRAFLVVGLAASLAVPCLASVPDHSVSTAVPRVRSTAPESSSVAMAWNWLRAWWPEAGCIIDPNGSHCVVPPPPPPLSRAGCVIDPSGSMTCARSRSRNPSPHAQ
jgi:hypothetical protein